MQQQRFLADARAPALSNLKSEARTRALLETQCLDAQLAGVRDVDQGLARVLVGVKYAEAAREILEVDAVDADGCDARAAADAQRECTGLEVGAAVVHGLQRLDPLGFEQHRAELARRLRPIDAPHQAR